MAEAERSDLPGSSEGENDLKSGDGLSELAENILTVGGLPNLVSIKKGQDDRKLSEIFKEGLNLFDEISNSDEPTNSVETQAKVRKAMNIFEDVTRMVSAADLFSKNESVNEIPTCNIRYLLLPALLGNLSLKLCVDERIEVVRTADVYFRDFLQRCKNYGVSEFEIPEEEEPAEETNPAEPRRAFDLASMARDRNLKLQRYKEQKELEGNIKELKSLMDLPNVSEDVERNFYLNMVKLYINLSFDELNSLATEKRMLAHMARVKKDAPSERQDRREKLRRFERKPLMPIIITRDEVQKKVFGAGYPSIPTMTVAEFYEKKVQDGEFPDPSKPRPLNALQDRAPQGMLSELADPTEAEEEEKERKVETDDPDSLRRAREWDEWKDDHRRGWGNRMNRS